MQDKLLKFWRFSHDASPVLLCGQQAVGLDHNEGVGRLHGKHEVVEVILAAKYRGAQAVRVFWGGEQA